MVEGILARQQIARLREQDHHEPHGDPAGGAVDVGGSDRGAVRLERFTMAPYQELDGFAHPLAEHFGQLRLPLAGVADELQEGRRRGTVLRRAFRHGRFRRSASAHGVFRCAGGGGAEGAIGGATADAASTLRLGRRPERGRGQGAEHVHLRGERAFLEPEVEIPLAPGVVVEPGEQQPPLPAVRHQRQVIVPGAQPAEHLAHEAAALADAEASGVVEEHRQPSPAPALPAGLDGLPGDRQPPPSGHDVAAARPRAGGCVEAADLLQHEGDEGGGAAGPCSVQHRARALAQPSFGAGVEGRGGVPVPGDGFEPRPVQQQAAVAQAFPTRQGRRRGSWQAPPAGALQQREGSDPLESIDEERRHPGIDSGP